MYFSDIYDLGPIRTAIVDEKFIMSVYDFINLITQHELYDVYARDCLRFLRKSFTFSINLNYKIKKFKGRGQRPTPIFDLYQAKELLVKMYVKINKGIYDKMLKLLDEYLDGTKQINEIKTYEENYDNISKKKLVFKKKEDCIINNLNRIDVINNFFNHVPGYKKNVICEYGIIDLISDTEIIVIRHNVKYKSAIGEILCYAEEYPNHIKRIHLYYLDDPTLDKNTNILYSCIKMCNIYNIELSFNKQEIL